MKTPTSEEIMQKLQQTHFPRKSAPEPLIEPPFDAPIIVTLEHLRPYEHNPRFIRNPLYEDIKASIRERGLDQPPSITRRPNEAHYIIRNGGNTRLSILGELWQETRDERFFRINCLFRPWHSEAHALLGHLTESDLHGQLTFIERALAVAKLKDMLEAGREPFSQRELAKRLCEGGYPISQSHVSRMLDTLEHLLPAIPQVLYAGLGKSAIERAISLHGRAESVWNRHATDHSGFATLWMAVLSRFDSEVAELETSQLQDELLAVMAEALGQSPRALALDMLQSGQRELATEPHLASTVRDGSDPGKVSVETAAEVPPAATGVPSVTTAAKGPSLGSPVTSASGAPVEELGERSAPLEQAHSPPAKPEPSANATDADTSPDKSAAGDSAAELRQTCATLARALADYADTGHLVSSSDDGLGFTLSLEQPTTLTPRGTGIHLLLAALLRLQDEVIWEQRQQLPAALFGQLLIGAYDIRLVDRPALSIGLERLPDAQLEQLFSLIRTARRLIELTLSSSR
jgi:ParB family protein of integrating conjugative element (PFGI_1 class)